MKKYILFLAIFLFAVISCNEGTSGLPKGDTEKTTEKQQSSENTEPQPEEESEQQPNEDDREVGNGWPPIIFENAYIEFGPSADSVEFYEEQEIWKLFGWDYGWRQAKEKEAEDYYFYDEINERWELKDIDRPFHYDFTCDVKYLDRDDWHISKLIVLTDIWIKVVLTDNHHYKISVPENDSGYERKYILGGSWMGSEGLFEIVQRGEQNKKEGEFLKFSLFFTASFYFIISSTSP